MDTKEPTYIVTTPDNTVVFSTSDKKVFETWLQHTKTFLGWTFNKLELDIIENLHFRDCTFRKIKGKDMTNCMFHYCVIQDFDVSYVRDTIFGVGKFITHKEVSYFTRCIFDMGTLVFNRKEPKYGITFITCLFNGADITGNLSKSYLDKSILTNCKLHDLDLTNTTLPPPSILLNNFWEHTKASTVKDLMNWDAFNHSNPKIFNDWAMRDGDCPYMDNNNLGMGRASMFNESKSLWAAEKSHRVKRPIQILKQLFTEKNIKFFN